jgi:hypothetical protein
MIGVHDVPAYIPGIYGLLLRRVPDDELFAHLRQIETQAMELCGNRERTQRVVQLLTTLRDDIEGAS